MNSAVRPESPYAIQKFAGEQYLRIYSNLYGLPTVQLRFFNVYGPKQDPKSPYSGVLSIMKDRFTLMENLFSMVTDYKQEILFMSKI